MCELSWSGTQSFILFCLFFFPPISQCFTIFPCSLCIYFHQLELLSLHFSIFSTDVIDNQPCVVFFLLTSQLSTQLPVSIMKCINKHKNKETKVNQNQSSPSVPFFTLGEDTISLLHCLVLQAPLLSVTHFASTPQTQSHPDQSNPDSEVCSFSCFG